MMILLLFSVILSFYLESGVLSREPEHAAHFDFGIGCVDEGSVTMYRTLYWLASDCVGVAVGE